MSYNAEIQGNNSDLQTILDKVNNLPEAGGIAEPLLQEKTATENGVVTPDAGYDGLSKVTVNVPIPDGYIKPSGTKTITENGTHDVTNYASAEVNVSSENLDTELAQQTTALMEQAALIAQLRTVLEGKAAGGGGSAEPDPSELYQRVEYIESAEAETYPYIITDIYADNNTGVEVIAVFPVLQDRVPMGSRKDSGTTRFYCTYPLSATSSYCGFNTGNSFSGSFAINTKYRCQTNFLGSRMAGIFDINGNRKSGGLIGSTLTTQTVPIAIFGYNNGEAGEVTSKREYKLYSSRISQGFEVVREYVPCYRKSDGVAGVYEKYTRAFLTTPVGAFTCGPEIDWEVAA